MPKEQDHFVEAKAGPVCPKHLRGGVLCTNLLPTFTCPEPHCQVRLSYSPPLCETCHCGMELKKTRNKLYYWRCEEHSKSAVFEVAKHFTAQNPNGGPPPTCPRHRTLCRLDQNHEELSKIYFSCPEDCSHTVVFDREKCKECGAEMALNVPPEGRPLSWFCKSKRHPGTVHFTGFFMCGCEGKGWDHYNNDDERGEHVQRCDDCHIFEDDYQAKAAHDKICLCHLTPRSDASESMGAWVERFRNTLNEATGEGPVMSVDRNGYPWKPYVGDSTRKELPLVSPATEAVRDLKKTAMELIGQLNNMNFQDHSVKDQRALEVCRRNMLNALATVEECQRVIEHKKGELSHQRDSAALMSDLASTGRVSYKKGDR